MHRINIVISDNLYKRYMNIKKESKRNLNISRVCQEAINKFLEPLEIKQKRFDIYLKKFEEM